MRPVSYYSYGMNRNDIRVTYAFDRQTVADIDQLAEAWGVSKSEATRRAVRMACERFDLQVARMSPAEVLEYGLVHPTRSRKETAAWQRDARALRKDWEPR